MIKNPERRKNKQKEYNKTYLAKAENKKTLHLATANWRRNNPTAADQIRRKAYLKKHYGITLEQYDELFKRFQGKCWICKNPQEHFIKTLSVDHDHHTGEVRGLLCYGCNRNVIGRNRNADIYLSAYEYLKGPFTGFFVPEQFLKGLPRKRKKRK